MAAETAGKAALTGAAGRALAAPDDRALIERAQAGDREAFETLVPAATTATFCESP